MDAKSVSDGQKHVLASKTSFYISVRRISRNIIEGRNIGKTKTCPPHAGFYNLTLFLLIRYIINGLFHGSLF